jgi:SAM-dependent methyltransferase
MDTEQQAWWTKYYRKLYSAAPPTGLDLSNEAVQAQTFAVAIEAAGAIGGRRCLDIGCGHGQLTTCLLGLRASEVVGVDIIPEIVASCREKYPGARWECGSPADEVFVNSLGDFDIIFLVEILQYVDWQSTLRMLWDCVHPGGRIVAVVPDKDDSIVQRTMSRFGGTYLPPNRSELESLVASLPWLSCWALRGMGFLDDQRLFPYVAGPWVMSGVMQGPANRLVLVIRKCDQPDVGSG